MSLSQAAQRLIRDAAAGRMPPLPDLPEIPLNKAAFPKVLALDCNHWIALARVHYQRSTDPAAQAALAAIRTAVSNGKLLIALHFINAFEATKRRDEASRERLVRFMVEEARGIVVRPFRQIRAAEYRAAIDSTYRAVPVPPVRGLVFGRGMDALMGSPPAESLEPVRAHARELGLAKTLDMLPMLFATPAFTAVAILDTIRDRGIAQKELDASGVMNRARLAEAGLSVKERKRLELRNQWDSGFGQDVQLVLDDLGLSLERFLAWLTNDDHLFAFWDAVPSVQVVLELEIASAKQRGRFFEANDFRDMSFYEAALPYANILVTEAYWADRIRYAKLQERYNTRILHRMSELPSLLSEEGCV